MSWRKPISLEKKLVRAWYDKGVSAHGEGAKLTDCPYEGDPTDCLCQQNGAKIRTWRKGWLAAEAERLKKSAAK